MNVYKSVSKSRASELAYKIIGVRTLDKADEFGFYFRSGAIQLRISNHLFYGDKISFKRFDYDNEWYDQPVFSCMVWVGDYYDRDLFSTHDGEHEIRYAWKD